MNDNVIGRVHDVILRSWAQPVAPSVEEVIRDRNMAFAAAAALAQSGLLNTNSAEKEAAGNPDAVADLVGALVKGHDELQTRIDAALAVCDQYIPHQYGMYESVAREVRAALTGEEQ